MRTAERAERDSSFQPIRVLSSTKGVLISTNNAATWQALAGSIIDRPCVLKTDRDSQFDIEFTASRSRLRLMPGTVLHVESSETEPGSTTLLDLRRGKILARVQNTKDAKFELKFLAGHVRVQNPETAFDLHFIGELRCQSGELILLSVDITRGASALVKAGEKGEHSSDGEYRISKMSPQDSESLSRDLAALTRTRSHGR